MTTADTTRHHGTQPPHGDTHKRTTPNAAIMRAWERVRQCMHTDLGETMWRIWLRELEFLAFTDGTVYLAHASEVAVRHIKNQYAARLRMYWRAELPEARAVHISQKKATASTTTPMAKANATANTINAKQGNTQCNTQDNTMEISKTDSCANSHDPHASDNYLCVNTDLLFSPNDLPRKPMVSSEGDAYANEAKDRDRPVYANEDDPGGGFLDPRMTFANFINGTPNHLAIAAAQEVATHPNAYNPLFIHGGVGLGKTHLLQAIAWHIRNKAEVQKIVYLSAERFMTHFLHALKTNETARFMNRFRSVDVLIMDDLHFICGKQKTQEEFFHTYNTLISQHKQVILAADRSPADLSLGEKLQSRLNRGMVVKVNPTNIALRLEILKARIVWERIDLPDRVLNYLAQKITGNVRELEGALTRINGHMRLYGSIPNMEEINEILADIIRVNKKRITIASIQRMVARHYSVKPDELLSRRRTQDIVRPRQVAMYLAKNLTRCSYPEIGRHFGNRDHTTIMHGVRVIEKAMAKDAEFTDEVKMVEGLVKKEG